MSVFPLKFLRRELQQWVILILLMTKPWPGHTKCDLKAIFNFGDSNSDTGGFWAAFPAQSEPFGTTYFGKPSGRATDGRLIIDFLAEALGIPFLSPYLKPIGSDYRHGANYATLASTVLLPNTSLFVSGISPFSLAIQLNQMKQFKAMVEQHQHSNGRSAFVSSNKNSPICLDTRNDTSSFYRVLEASSSRHFGKSLYTMYIGQNDFTSNLAAIGIHGVEQYLPQVANQIAWTVKELYALGGRTFMVFNLAPVGCYPALLVEPHRDSSDIDEFGCMISYNNAVMNYNKLLKDTLDRTRPALSNASLVYVDIYTILLDLFRRPTSHGLVYGTRACCGHGGGAYNFDPKLYCGNKKQEGGRILTAKACKDPHKYVSWDGIHTSEAANKLQVFAILNGSYFDPPFPLHRLCHLHPLS